MSKKYSIWYTVGVVLISALVTLQACLQAPKSYDGTREYPRYNNYLIFKESFHHLANSQNLYVVYPEAHWDLYKYPPTFALFMAPFSVLPDWLGLFLWNLLNAWTLIYALSRIHFPSLKMKFFAHIFLLPELLTSLQNAQSNALLAGLGILGFVMIQESKQLKSVSMILLGTFTKPFALALFLPFIAFTKKWKMVLYAILVALILFLSPLLLVSWSELLWQYENWFVMLADDHAASVGISVMGWLNTWFGFAGSKNLILLLGVLLLLLPLIKLKCYSHPQFQKLLLASVLLWVILFNHKSESPTFIIAVSGIVIWFFTQANHSKLDIGLVVFAFLFTCLIATDLFPRFIRKEYAEPYVWKVIPCILIWLRIQYQLLKLTPSKIT